MTRIVSLALLGTLLLSGIAYAVGTSFSVDAEQASFPATEAAGNVTSGSNPIVTWTEFPNRVDAVHPAAFYLVPALAQDADSTPQLTCTLTLKARGICQGTGDHPNASCGVNGDCGSSSPCSYTAGQGIKLYMGATALTDHTVITAGMPIPDSQIVNLTSPASADEVFQATTAGVVNIGDPCKWVSSACTASPASQLICDSACLGMPLIIKVARAPDNAGDVFTGFIQLRSFSCTYS